MDQCRECDGDVSLVTLYTVGLCNACIEGGRFVPAYGSVHYSDGAIEEMEKHPRPCADCKGQIPWQEMHAKYCGACRAKRRGE